MWIPNLLPDSGTVDTGNSDTTKDSGHSDTTKDSGNPDETGDGGGGGGDSKTITGLVTAAGFVPGSATGADGQGRVLRRREGVRRRERGRTSARRTKTR